MKIWVVEVLRRDRKWVPATEEDSQWSLEISESPLMVLAFSTKREATSIMRTMKGDNPDKQWRVRPYV